jgi:hypothetical protein
LLIGILLASAVCAPPILAAPVLATDPRIVYVGRFDFRNGATCQWSASEVRLKVRGSTLAVSMVAKGDDHWQVVVSGRATEVLTPSAGRVGYTINLGLNAVHDVQLVKRTEPFVGTTTFQNFSAPGGAILKATPAKRHLEFVGDSITCGYGNEGAAKEEHFKPETENAYLSYASITARQLGADVTILAWSGRKMWPDNTVPEIYDLTLPTQPETKWDFKGPAPDAVVINLATNDFGKDNPDEAKWTGAYEAFIRRVWSHYPKAQIYVAIGSMMSDNWPPEHKALTTLRAYLNHLATRMGDPRVHEIEFDVQKESDGIGSDWHPNVRTHEKMANRLTAAIKRDLHW